MIVASLHLGCQVHVKKQPFQWLVPFLFGLHAGWNVIIFTH